MTWLLYDGPIPYDIGSPYDPALPSPASPYVRSNDIWRYRFYQCQNGQPGFTSETHLFDLPINQASFMSKLNDVGQFQGVVQMSDPTVQQALLGQPALHLLCERTAIYVELNGALVWGGVLQQVQYDSISQQAQIQGQDWWGYFANNRNITWNVSYSAVDQLYAAADLFNCAQGAPYSSAAGGSFNIPGYTPSYSGVVGGNVGVLLGFTAQQALAGTYLSGNDITQSWQMSAAKALGQAIDDLSNATNGFDFTIDVAYDSTGAPTKTFNIWYPRAGRTFQVQLLTGGEVVFNLPGLSGQDYQWPTGQDKPSNSLLGSGSGAAGQAVQDQESDPTLLQTGWPLLEDNVSFADISDQNLLAQVTLATLNQRKYPISLPQVQYNPGMDSDQPLGSFAMGDDARLIIAPDPYFQDGYDSARGNYGEQWWRVVQNQVTVNDEGKSNMVLTFAQPPILPGE